jgi:hypothetical protein
MTTSTAAIKQGTSFKLSPSALTFSWESCQRCFWLETHGYRSPSIPMPAVFNRIDAHMKTCLQGQQLELCVPGMPASVTRYSDEWVESRKIRLPGHTSTCFIRGRFDTVVEFEDGSFGIVDFKTTERRADHIPLYARQLNAYALALEHPSPRAFGIKPVNRMGLIVFEPDTFLGPGFGVAALAGSLRWIEIPRDDKAFRQFIEEVLTILEQPEPPLGTADCAYCRYRATTRELGL